MNDFQFGPIAWTLCVIVWGCSCVAYVVLIALFLFAQLKTGDRAIDVLFMAFWLVILGFPLVSGWKSLSRGIKRKQERTA